MRGSEGRWKTGERAAHVVAFEEADTVGVQR